MCELNVTVKLYRATCSLSDADSLFEQEVRQNKIRKKKVPSCKWLPMLSLSEASIGCSKTANELYLSVY